MKTRRFVAWDTEGASIDGADRPIYLANSDGVEIKAPDGIPSIQIWETIAAADPNATHVIFAGGYDVNVWTWDWPLGRIGKLWERGRARHDKYRIRYLPRRRVAVDHITGWKVTEKGRRPVLSRSIAIHDVWGFFGSSFVTAVRSWLGEGHPLLDVIMEGKARRGRFTAADLDTYIPRYTRAELAALVALMEQFAAAMDKLGWKVRRWEGAGAVAAALLQQYRSKHVIPGPGDYEQINLPVRSAYFGGHIELVRYGFHNGPIYGHDIRSAYPAALAAAPDFKAGEWIHEAEPEKVEPTGIYRARFQWSVAPWYPLPFRLPTGSILYPQSGEGWYWGRELLAAMHYPGRVEIVEGWRWVGDRNSRPWAWVAEAYEARAAYKRRGEAGPQLALKLGINSLYGKLAQQLGWSEQRNRLPPYHSLLLAGWITAYTRAELLLAAAADPDAVVLFATDGIYTIRPLPVTVGPNLGEWEATEHSAGLFVQAGVYAVEQGGELRMKYRGFDPGSITPELVLNGWANRRGILPIPQTRFVTMGAALGREEPARWHRRWVTGDRELRIDGVNSKRSGVAGYYRAGGPRLDRRLYLAEPQAPPPTGEVSAPYTVLWDLKRDQEMLGPTDL